MQQRRGAGGSIGADRVATLAELKLVVQQRVDG
jgi:hypothetical protein